MPSRKAGIGSAIAKGVQGYATGRADRDAAKVRQAEGQAKLDKLQHQKETGSVQTQIDAINSQNKELIRANQQQATFRALDAYTADYDTKHLNQLMNEPMLKAKFKNTVSVDRVDPANDMRLINQHGIPPELFNDPATKDNVAGRLVKVTLADGSKKILDMMNIYSGTGYTKHLDQQKLADLVKRASLTKSTKGPSDAPIVRDAKVTAAAQERIDAAKAEGKDPDPVDVETIKFANKEKGGVRPGQLDISEDRTTQLVKKFGGEDQFFKTDFSEPDNFRKAYADVAAIERLEGAEYTAKEKTDLNDIRTLIAMGDPAKNLTANETGVYDSTFLGVKKYLSDEVEGVAATSAYAAFRNMTRHVLYGSALTEAEITSYKEAFGTLGQKLGPVLQQFKTSMLQVRGKLESVSRMKNPYSAHVRLGVDEERLDRILTSLDSRMEMLNSLDVQLDEPAKKKVGEIKGFGGKK